VGDDCLPASELIVFRPLHFLGQPPAARPYCGPVCAYTPARLVDREYRIQHLSEELSAIDQTSDFVELRPIRLHD
jgi:hypothetical protein